MSEPSYPGCAEIAPGVFLAEDAVYIADEHGEVVCWTYDEVKEDPSAWVASIVACVIAAREGVHAVRRRMP